MSLHMEFVLGACGKLSRAQIALKGLLSCVDSYVFLKIPILVEGLLTIRTLEGFRPIVPSHVRYKAGSVFELLPTLVTKELGLERVDSFVRGQVALSLERLVALVTGKGALASVCLEMSSQEISDLESLLTTLVSTGVDLGIVHGEPEMKGSYFLIRSLVMIELLANSNKKGGPGFHMSRCVCVCVHGLPPPWHPKRI